MFIISLNNVYYKRKVIIYEVNQKIKIKYLNDVYLQYIGIR